LHPRFAGSNPAEGNGFLRVINIRSVTSFGVAVNPSVPCPKILRHVKIFYKVKVTVVGKIKAHFSQSFSCFATRLIFLFIAREL
jgi:hypothetical protein